MNSNSFTDIREEINQYKGRPIKCRVTHSRNKVEETQGVVADVYPKLFTLFIESQQSHISFSYAEILTKELEIELV
ncbi:MAG: Veg family protein [Synergistaceae bacterium]|nr:Veg family protein [Synergistaceae bacterium]